jgi:Galactose oxidase, central domain
MMYSHPSLQPSTERARLHTLPHHRLGTILFVLFLVAACRATAVGTWVAVAHQTPNVSPNGNPSLMLLLSDGTVMVENDPTGGGGSNWFRLTPDIHGSYVNGTWTSLAPMHYTRAGCSSFILTNGQVFVAGGEYGTGGATAEAYDPVANTWTVAPVPTSILNPTNQSPIWGTGVLQSFGDSIAEILADGNVLVAPVAVAYPRETVIYDPVSNSFTAGPNLKNASSQSEASWVKLPDNSILTIDPSSTNSERYIPSLNQWISDANVPVVVYSTNSGVTGAAPGELGPGFLLPNGKAFFCGSTTHNAVYTPSGSTNAGAWSAGPDYPMAGTNAQGMPDAPGAMMVNGKILCATGVANTFNGPINFFEYDYVSNAWTQVSSPSSAASSAAPYYTKFLDLPDGNVLWNYGSPQLYIYKPDGVPVALGKPVIASIRGNADGSYHLTGMGLNGISEGAAYGDDAQMASNYPLVRLTNGVGSVYYARTFNWSSTGVMTSNKVVTTEFTLLGGLAAGTYSLVAVANGIASDPVQFTIPLTQPSIASLNVVGANVVVNGVNGLAGRTYYLLTSTNLTAPLSQWTAVATNLLAANGSFSITASNAVNSADAQRYFLLEAQ